MQDIGSSDFDLSCLASPGWQLGLPANGASPIGGSLEEQLMHTHGYYMIETLVFDS